jgi:hypothetical protein
VILSSDGNFSISEIEKMSSLRAGGEQCKSTITVKINDETQTFSGASFGNNFFHFHHAFSIIFLSFSLRVYKSLEKKSHPFSSLSSYRYTVSLAFSHAFSNISRPQQCEENRILYSKQVQKVFFYSANIFRYKFN